MDIIHCVKQRKKIFLIQVSDTGERKMVAYELGKSQILRTESRIPLLSDPWPFEKAESLYNRDYGLIAPQLA